VTINGQTSSVRVHAQGPETPRVYDMNSKQVKKDFMVLVREKTTSHGWHTHTHTQPHKHTHTHTHTLTHTTTHTQPRQLVIGRAVPGVNRDTAVHIAYSERCAGERRRRRKRRKRKRRRRRRKRRRRRRRAAGQMLSINNSTVWHTDINLLLVFITW